MNGVRALVAAAFCALAIAACGGGATSTATATAAATSVSTSTPATTAALTATPQASVTFMQSIAVGKALFPVVNGKYLECDASPDAILACPFDARLKAQVLTYAANKQRLCPQGCGGALLLLRQQCGGFSNETVSTPQNQAIAIVMLSGNTCVSTSGTQTMYVSVVIENGQPLADDVMCAMGDPKYGMYNSDPNATGGNPCAPFS